ncbi:hypothetical protein F2P56_012981 [Juglans regia]|uniref:F-box/kelch-repeat protein At3g06240-like n=1 Tax=Juglans regia TaxID=51240 RepID=A0A833XQ45_JUGRE|nr:hypothetical protein F2P56_012981 [Juglans regia]KAF5468870.1 hypothetical protein F2P56_012981 [Juglans regia]
MLWNPATRESKRLPFVPRPPDFVPLPLDICFTSYKFGFGIDLNTNDFKVVKITCFYSPPHYQVEVYNLTTDSWRRCDREHNLLLSFDMSNEIFREIMLPDDVGSPADIAIINDSVAVIFPTYSNSSRNDVGISMEYEIWVMNESIVECSWTKLFTIAVPSRPLQFRDDGLIVLNGGHCVSDKCLVLFDPRTGELKNLPIYDEGSETILDMDKSWMRVRNWLGEDYNVYAVVQMHASNLNDISDELYALYEMIPLHREDIKVEIVDAIVDQSVESSEVSTNDESETIDETDIDD